MTLLLDKVVWLCTTPRVGQNAVLGALRHVVPGAAEGKATARASDGVLIFSSQSPVKLPAARETYYVRMSRRDTVSQAISWVQAQQSGRYHSHQAASGELRFSREEVERAKEAIELRETEWDAYLEGVDALRLVYEDDVESDATAAAQRILDYAGIPGTAGPTDVHRFDSSLKLEWLKMWSERS